MSVYQYARFCGPTALATLLGISRREAAEYLTAEGCNHGDGGTSNWGGILEGLGGAKFDPTTPEDDDRYDDAVDKYFSGERRTRPKHSLRYPTVAEVLRRYPEGVYVLWTTSHTLVAKDGEVIGDTKATKSMRARCHTLYRFRELEKPGADLGLPKDEAEELEALHDNIRASRARLRRDA